MTECGFAVGSPEVDHGREVYSLLVATQPDEPVTSCDLHLTDMIPFGIDVVVRRVD